MEPEPLPLNAALLVSRAVISTPSMVSPETPIEEAIAQMNACEDSYVLITQNRQPAGIFTERDLVRLIASGHPISNKSIAQVMTQPVITIHKADITDAFSVFEQMQQHRLRHLPVVEADGTLFGIITKNSLRKALTPSTLLKLKLVESVMQTNVVCAPTSTKVRQIAQKMSEEGVSCVVILAPDARPIGIVTERDIVQFQTLGLDMATTSAQTVMSTPLLPVHPKDSLWQTHQQMNQHRVRRFVVCTRSGKLAGLVTQSSLLQALNPTEVKQMIDLLQQEVEQLRTDNQTLLEVRNQALENEQVSLNERLKSEQRELQQAYVQLNKINADLEERVMQRSAELSQSERRWRTLLEDVQLAVVGVGHDGHVTYANPFLLDLVGYSAEETMGADWIKSFIPGPERSQVEDYFEQLYHQSEVPLQHQHSILTKSGEARILVWNNTLLRDTQGNAIGSMSIGEDVTERFAVDKLKGDFVAMVSHELRTPLTTIHGGIKLLSHGIVTSQSEQGQHILQVAAESSERLVRLVGDILALERLESGRSPLRRQLVHTRALTRQIAGAFELLATNANVAIEIDDPGLQIVADSDRLNQVLTNLLDNAIKFSPPGSTIRVTTTPDYKDIDLGEGKSLVCFSVCDEGVGIPTDQQSKVFERFTQVGHNNAQAKGGTGLGLAICRNIIEQHGGKIWVESTVGEGSCFRFALPVSG